jgi:hypothetical protein
MVPKPKDLTSVGKKLVSEATACTVIYCKVSDCVTSTQVLLNVPDREYRATLDNLSLPSLATAKQ